MTREADTSTATATSNRLMGRVVAFVVANEGVEQVELTSPWRAVEQAGGSPVLISIEAGDVQALHHLDKGDVFQATGTTADANPDDYDAVVRPGGIANPDRLRTDAAAVSFIRDFVGSGRPVAAVCHGPWTLIEAGVVDGRTMTSWPSLRTDIENAGGHWVDESVVVDHGLITSRNPGDLEAFAGALLDSLTKEQVDAR